MAARPCTVARCSDQIGGFDEDLFAYGDDAELGLRARIAGWKCIYTPAAVARHHRGSTLGRDSERRLELIERNRALLALKLFPWSLLWLNPFYFATRLAGRSRGRRARKRRHGAFPWNSRQMVHGPALLRGDLAALRLAPRMLRKRAAIDRFRRLSPREVRRLILSNRLSLKEVV